MNDPKKEICRWRDRIDEIDLELVKLLNERTKCAEEIGKIKLLLGLEAYSPEREEEVKRNVTTINRGPLSIKAIQRLFERIIDESRSAERMTMEEKKKRLK
ncbi:MAG: chorismate mutase [Bacteroidota bacterium]|jgi:chorismate mutase